MGAMPEVEQPEVPLELEYLHNLYTEIKFSRINNPEYNQDEEGSIRYKLIPRKVITWLELKSYSDVTGFELQPWEGKLIMQIDGVFEYSRGG